MKHILLNEDQKNQIMHADGPIEVRDSKGKLLGRLFLSSEEAIIAKAKRNRASNKRRIPSHRVQAHLQMLETAAQNGFGNGQLQKLSANLLNSWMEIAG